MEQPKLLIVEADSMVQAIVELFLSPSFACTAVATPAEAYQALARRPYAAVLCDLGPNGDAQQVALEFCRWARARSAALVVLAMMADHAAGALAVQDGIDVLAKPFNAQRLRAALDAGLRR
jgi:DNA-binding response OmpR family regulator